MCSDVLWCDVVYHSGVCMCSDVLWCDVVYHSGIARVLHYGVLRYVYMHASTIRADEAWLRARVRVIVLCR